MFHVSREELEHVVKKEKTTEALQLMATPASFI